MSLNAAHLKSSQPLITLDSRLARDSRPPFSAMKPFSGAGLQFATSPKPAHAYKMLDLATLSRRNSALFHHKTTPTSHWQTTPMDELPNPWNDSNGEQTLKPQFGNPGNTTNALLAYQLMAHNELSAQTLETTFLV